MDAEAAARGTTVYLVDKRIDMLPSLLGTNLCSLRPHVERLAFSAIWVCDGAGGSMRVKLTERIGNDERGGYRGRAVCKVCDCVQGRVHVRTGTDKKG